MRLPNLEESKEDIDGDGKREHCYRGIAIKEETSWGKPIEEDENADTKIGNSLDSVDTLDVVHPVQGVHPFAYLNVTEKNREKGVPPVPGDPGQTGLEQPEQPEQGSTNLMDTTQGTPSGPELIPCPKPGCPLKFKTPQLVLDHGIKAHKNFPMTAELAARGYQT